MNRLPHPAIDPDDMGYNDSDNPDFADILTARLSRRGLLRGGLGGAAVTLLGGLGLSGCATPGTGGDIPTTVGGFNFNPVAKSLADAITLPKGYSAEVIYAVGDPLKAGLGAYRNDGSDVDFDWRAGDHHDGMEYFGLKADGSGRDDAGVERGLLAMNHENVTATFLHPAGPTLTGGRRPQQEVDREIAAHGVSIVEVRKVNGRFKVNAASRYNRRITPQTPVEIHGPVRGSLLVRTRHSTNATKARGTLNNCAVGRTPWGTFLTCEENWAFYFARAKDDDSKRTPKEQHSLRRYGLMAGADGMSGWASVGEGDFYRRWDMSRNGKSADGSDDYRNEANTFG